MPNRPPSKCRYCGRAREEVGYISWRGCCSDCGDYRVIANHHGMKQHSGPFFDHWRRRSLAALGVFNAPAAPDT